MSKTFFKFISMFCALGILSFENLASSPSLKKFHAGIYINRINDFNVKTGTAEVDFWYWVVCNDENVSLQNLDLSNGKLKSVGDVITQKKDGRFYISCRYIAYAKCILDMRNFPFDEQCITLSFEDGDLTSDLMVFVPDAVNSGIDPTSQMNGWKVKNIEYKVGEHYYPSTFGDLDITTGQGSSYSQFKVNIFLTRRGSFWEIMFKYFWAVSVAVIVGLFSLLIRVRDLDGRFGMAVGALFAHVGCSFLISEMLPPSPSISTAELVSGISLGFIMLFLIESIISLNLYNGGHKKFSRWLDFSVFSFSILCLGGICFFI